MVALKVVITILSGFPSLIIFLLTGLCNGIIMTGQVHHLYEESLLGQWSLDHSSLIAGGWESDELVRRGKRNIERQLE